MAAGMMRRELTALTRLHPLVAILTKALETKDKANSSLEGGRQLVAALLEKAIEAHKASHSAPYPYLLVSRSQLTILQLYQAVEPCCITHMPRQASRTVSLE